MMWVATQEFVCTFVVFDNKNLCLFILRGMPFSTLLDIS